MICHNSIASHTLPILGLYCSLYNISPITHRPALDSEGPPYLPTGGVDHLFQKGHVNLHHKTQQTPAVIPCCGQNPAKPGPLVVGGRAEKSERYGHTSRGIPLILLLSLPFHSLSIFVDFRA